MSETNWDKELARIDRSSSPSRMHSSFPKRRARRRPRKRRSQSERSGATSWPALLRLALSVALGVGMLFWPYANRCGIGLAGYLIAVSAVAASGIWSAVWTWRHRAGRAHVLSILLIVWGLVLGATEVLPRVGYAKEALKWSCGP